MAYHHFCTGQKMVVSKCNLLQLRTLPRAEPLPQSPGFALGSARFEAVGGRLVAAKIPRRARRAATHQPCTLRPHNFTGVWSYWREAADPGVAASVSYLSTT
jgi:hypothetical protein